MTALIQPRHDLSPLEIDAIEENLYNHNHSAVGRDDGQGLGFVIQDEQGRTVGVAAATPGPAFPNSSRCGSIGASRARLRRDCERFRHRSLRPRRPADLGGELRFPGAGNVRKSRLQADG